VRYYRIKNWERFQYSKDGVRFKNLAWIKLHRDILISHDWIKATDHRKVCMIVLILLANDRGEGRLDEGWVRAAGGLKAGTDWVYFVKSGFIELIDQNGNIDDNHMYLLSNLEKKFPISGVDLKGRDEIERNNLREKMRENKKKKIYTD
jgi:hypothetical protein